MSAVLALCVGAVRPAEAQTISTSPTTSLLTRIGAFPAYVMATINTLTTQAQLSAATLALDSAARTDNVALQLGLLSSSRAGVGVKYWLTELTALQVDLSTGVNVGLGFSPRWGDSKSNLNRQLDTIQNSYPTNSSGYASGFAPTVNLDLLLSATIEKHLFPKRALSPFIGFGASVSVYSFNNMEFTSGFANGKNTTDRNFYFNNRIYYAIDTTNQDNTSYRQEVFTSTSVGVTAYVFVGVEYFVLPFLSLTAKAALNGTDKW